MSQERDFYEEAIVKPWSLRKRVLPTRTYSGRVVYSRKPHLFTLKDAERILAKLEPSPDETGNSFSQTILRFLRDTTIAMLDKILFFLDSRSVENFYQFLIEILDRFFRIDTDNRQLQIAATRLIQSLANRFGWGITINKGD